jgi:hypothetical protein
MKTSHLCIASGQHALGVCLIAGYCSSQLTPRSQTWECLPSRLPPHKSFLSRTSGSWGAACQDIGTRMLPFSITPSDTTSSHTRTMLTADRVHADTFDLGRDPESGAIAPFTMSWLRRMSGYTRQTWMEARSQNPAAHHSWTHACFAQSGTPHGSVIETLHPPIR